MWCWHERHRVSWGRAPPGGYSEKQVDRVHAEAFRELENNLRDCVRIGKIAANLTCGAKIEDPTLSFAVFHLAEMLMRLEKEYDARWHGMSRKRAHSQARAR